jgi:hypothetical protein
MNNLKPNNPCTRCGKQRVQGGVSKEPFGDGFVTVTEMICPDGDCQKMVEKKLADEKRKREEMSSSGKRGNPGWLKK